MSISARDGLGVSNDRCVLNTYCAKNGEVVSLSDYVLPKLSIILENASNKNC